MADPKKEDATNADEKTHSPSQKSKDVVEEELVKFSPEEEAALLQESSTVKTEANALFTSSDFDNALARYHDALESCPRYRFFERAVLHSNVAACHLKLEQWKEAVRAATDSLDALQKLEEPREDKAGSGESKDSGTDGSPGGSKSEDGADAGDTVKVADKEDSDVEEEIVSSGAAKSAPSPATPSHYPRPSDVLRIRTKALLRRARARSAAATWSDLSSAEEDYKALAALPPGSLTPADTRVVRQQLRDLPPRTKAAQEREMGEMWGKLRQLGDGILKPFGLSTNNFQMVQDEKTGGYSMNFTQGGGGSGGGSGGGDGS